MLGFMFSIWKSTVESTVICESVPHVAHSPHAGSGKHKIVFKQVLFSVREELQGVVKSGKPDFYAFVLLPRTY